MAELKIVKGNDFYLKIKVTKKIVGGSSTEPLSLANVSDLKISLINIRETVLPTTLSTDELGVCYSLVSGLAVGTYDLQLTGKYNGNPIRSCELKTVTIVNNNASSNVTPNTYEGEDAYNVDIAVMLFTGSTGISDAPEDGKEYARKDGEWVEVDAIPGIVDNLSSNDSTKTLSAKQGKVLDGKVSDIATKILEKPTASGTQGQVLSLDAQGKTVWKDESGGGGGTNRVIIPVTLDETQTSETIISGTVPKTYAEVKALVESGTDVVFKLTISPDNGTTTYTFYSNSIAPYANSMGASLQVEFGIMEDYADIKYWGLMSIFTNNKIVIYPESPFKNLAYVTGNLTDLTTTSKTNLVSAINELDSEVGDIGLNKLDKPTASGTSGQVLGLDDDLTPKWVDQSGGGSEKAWTKIGCLTLDNDTTEYSLDFGGDYTEVILIGVRTYDATNKGIFDIYSNNIRIITGLTFTQRNFILKLNRGLYWWEAKYFQNNNIFGSISSFLYRFSTQFYEDMEITDGTLSNIKLDFTTALVGDDTKKMTIYAR